MQDIFLIAALITEDPDIFNEENIYETGKKLRSRDQGQVYARKQLEKSNHLKVLMRVLGHVAAAVKQRSTVPQKRHNDIMLRFVNDVKNGDIDIRPNHIEEDLVKYLSSREYFNLSSKQIEMVKRSLHID